MIHLVHDFTGETVLIFGGGSVGARRARTFDDADVVVVSPEFVDANFGSAALVRIDPSVDDARELITRADPVLVVLATDDGEFNASVADEARDFGALVNRTDQAAIGRRAVDVPAIARDGSVVASVSTGGLSPTLSGQLRDRIAEELEGSGELARVSGALRTELRDRGIPSGSRREAFRSIVENDHVWNAAREGEPVRPPVIRAIEDLLQTRTERDNER